MVSVTISVKDYVWLVFISVIGSKVHVVLWCLCLLAYTGVQHCALSLWFYVLFPSYDNGNVFTFVFQYCDVHYVFRIKTIFVSLLPLVVCRGLMSYSCYLCVLVYLTRPDYEQHGI